jgi:nitrogen fixation protein NifX
MCPPRLSSELALRVGRAADVVGVDTRAFVPILIEALGLPFTKSRFGKISVSRLTAALSASADPAARYAAGESDAIRKAVQFLWGFSDQDVAWLPLPGPVADVMPGSIRVAIASTRGERVDAHFGNTLRFFIYQVSSHRVRLIDIRSIADAVDAQDVNDFRVELLRDCQLLYVESIGGPPAGKVVQRGIYPLKVNGQPPIGEELGRLRSKMADHPPPWLAKAMGTPVEDRIRYTDVSRT